MIYEGLSPHVKVYNKSSRFTTLNHFNYISVCRAFHFQTVTQASQFNRLWLGKIKATRNSSQSGRSAKRKVDGKCQTWRSKKLKGAGRDENLTLFETYFKCPECSNWKVFRNKSGWSSNIFVRSRTVYFDVVAFDWGTEFRMWNCTWPIKCPYIRKMNCG